MTTTKPTLTLAQARLAASAPHHLAELIGIPYAKWGARCHEISLALLRTGEFGNGRVARGWAAGVSSQHSWIVLGDNCYDPDAIIVDPTIALWTGTEARPAILVDRARVLGHRPHGWGIIWSVPPAPVPTGDIIELTPSAPLSREAREFLNSVGPLDIHGWMAIAHYPVLGWPAGEIFAAMDDTPTLRALVSIDILGMTTDRNPNGVYR